MEPQHWQQETERGPHRSLAQAILSTARTMGMLSLALSVSGCFAFVYSRHVSRVCNVEAARSAGESDALAGDAPRESYAEICGVSEAALNRTYREAYDAVEQERRGSERGFLPRLGR